MVCDNTCSCVLRVTWVVVLWNGKKKWKGLLIEARGFAPKWFERLDLKLQNITLINQWNPKYTWILYIYIHIECHAPLNSGTLHPIVRIHLASLILLTSSKYYMKIVAVLLFCPTLVSCDVLLSLLEVPAAQSPINEYIYVSPSFNKFGTSSGTFDL